MKAHLILIVAVFLFTTSYGQFNSETKEAINSILADHSSPDGPGVALSIVHDGKLLYSNAFGARDVPNKLAIDVNTKFLAGDIANQFTAMAVLKLVMRKKIKLSDDIRLYIPELPKYDYTVRIENLLTHTHGLPDYMMLRFIDGHQIDAPISTQNAIKLITTHDQLCFIPGEAEDYNSTGFLIAGEIIARVSGQSFNEYMDQHIFKPLNMADTHFQGDWYEVVPNKAFNYVMTADGVQGDVLPYHHVNPSRLYTSVEDLAKWVLELDNPSIFTPEHINLLNSEFTLRDGTGINTAFGQFFGEFNGLQRFHHNGLAYGNMTYLSRIPSLGYGIAILSNDSEYNVNQKAIEITDLLLSDYYDSPAQEQVADDHSYHKIDYELLKSYEGKYWDSEHFSSREIVMRNDTLRYIRSNGSSNDLVAINDTTFRMINVGTQVTVELSQTNPGSLIFRVNNDYYYQFYKYDLPEYSHEDLMTYQGTYYSDVLGSVFTVRLKEQHLVISKPGRNDVILSALSYDHFSTDTWYFGEISFKRDVNNIITGFTNSAYHLNNLKFQKISIQNHEAG